MKQLFTLLAAALLFTACSSTCDTAEKNSTITSEMKNFKKTYTNADFYKDGKFQADVAEKAFREMFAHYDYPITPFLEKNWWFTDFGLGDFENTGMGGVFWLNDADNGYFAHDIYLLPGQMIPEHNHVETEFPAKIESWLVRNGSAYNFSEIGEATPGCEEFIAKSQIATAKSRNCELLTPGELRHLKDKGVGTFHFLRAGDQGAIVHEYANYHDGAGLGFSNPEAKM